MTLRFYSFLLVYLLIMAGGLHLILSESDLSDINLIDHVLQSHKDIIKLSGFNTKSVISKVANRDITFVYRFHSFFSQ